MKIRILGCSGGIGSERRTTAFLVDADILIDCGTGVGDLRMEELARIDHVFLTHSHLDHIACLPLLIDTIGARRQQPLTVHAQQATLDILRQHIFNDLIWPDFSRIPSTKRPFLRYAELPPGATASFAGRRITALPASHVVPAAAYQIDSGEGSLVYSGDTGPCPALWQAINTIGNLRVLIFETAFPDEEHALAALAKHMCPAALAEEFKHLKLTPEIFITHLKPDQADLTMQQVIERIGARRPKRLYAGQEFEL